MSRRAPTPKQAEAAAKAVAAFLAALRAQGVAGPVAVEVSGLRSEFGTLDDSRADGAGLPSLE